MASVTNSGKSGKACCSTRQGLLALPGSHVCSTHTHTSNFFRPFDWGQSEFLGLNKRILQRWRPRLPLLRCSVGRDGVGRGGAQHTYAKSRKRLFTSYCLLTFIHATHSLMFSSFENEIVCSILITISSGAGQW